MPIIWQSNHGQGFWGGAGVTPTTDRPGSVVAIAMAAATVPIFPLALALLLGGLPPSLATAATVGNVFVSYAADGVPRYASQRLDGSYRLFIRGENVPAARRSVSRQPASESQHHGNR